MGRDVWTHLNEEVGDMSIEGLERDERGLDDGEDLLLVGWGRAIGIFDRYGAEGGGDRLDQHSQKDDGKATEAVWVRADLGVLGLGDPRGKGVGVLVRVSPVKCRARCAMGDVAEGVAAGGVSRGRSRSVRGGRFGCCVPARRRRWDPCQ
jgi:hypothetical protein